MSDPRNLPTLQPLNIISPAKPSIITPWGGNGLGEIVYLRTYSREIEELGRREHWPETIERVIQGLRKIGAKLTEAEEDLLRAHMGALRGTVSGRALWQLGTALVDQAGMDSLVNCLSGETGVITSDGIKQIRDLAGKVPILMTEYGRWVEAPVQSFGVQSLMAIYLVRGKARKVIRATAEHGWFVRGQSRVGIERDKRGAQIRCTTKELLPGNRLVSIVGQGVKNAVPSSVGIAAGFTYGDGLLGLNHGPAIACFCGPKDQEMRQYFAAPKIQSEWITPNGVSVTSITGLPRSWKAPPSLDESRTYLYGWLAGYFAADGSVRKGGAQVRLASADLKSIEFARDLCVRLGIRVISTTSQNRLGYGTELTPLYTLAIDAESVNEDFFCLSEHRQRWLSRIPVKPKDWVVEKVEDLNIQEEVFCAVVPETHSFVLESNIKTSNCWFNTITEAGDLRWIMDRLMVGGGVGFSVERSNIYKFPKVKKAAVTHFRAPDTDFIVPDTRRGWSELVFKVIEAHFSGESFSYSTMLVRDAGAPLKTFGGTASGPTVLIDGVAEMCKLMCARAGKNLRSVDVLDLANLIGKVVVAGSARRSAQIAIGDPDDALFIRAKRWALGNIPTWRANSNNTLVVDHYDEIANDQAFWRNFDGGSEPYGLFNRQLARTMGRLGERRPDPSIEGINPCAEATLAPRESCNLATIWLPNVRSFDEFTEISRILYKVQKATALLPHPDPQTAAIVHKNLRLGQNVTGILQASEEQQSWMAPGYEALRAFDKEWSSELGVNESVRLSVIQPGGCRPWDALTTTDAGILTLQEIFTNHEDEAEWSPVYDLSAIQDEGHNTPISRSYVNGVAKTLRISLNYGFDLISTLQHPWWVQERIERTKEIKHQIVEKWVPAQELRINDVLKLVPGVYTKQEHAPLKRIKTTAIRMRGDSHPITQPSELTPDLSWLLGYLWGDGAQSPVKRRIRFMDERLENLEKATRIIRGVFGLEASLQARHDNKSYELTVASVELWHFLLANNIWKYASETELDIIPEVVRRSSQEDVIAFIAGLLDSDGWAGALKADGYLHVTISTAERHLANNLQHVALAVGLVFGRGEQFYRNNNPGPSAHKGQKGMTNLVLTGHTTETALTFLRSHSTKLQKLGHLSNKPAHSILGKIKSISVGEEVPTFDIEVPDGHWYYAGGVKSHNTLSNLPGVTSGIHAAYAHHYIRRVRFGASDPLVEMCRKRGYPVTPSLNQDGSMDHTQMIVEFPVEAPTNTPIASEMSAVEQLEKLTFAQRVWADMAVSCTISYRPEELREIRKWLSKHYDNEVKSVSFLLYSDHGFVQAPYEPISEEEYLRRAAKIRTDEIDIHGLSSLDEADCIGGACPTR